METEVDSVVSSTLDLAASKKAKLCSLVLRGSASVDVEQVKQALSTAGHPDVNVEWEHDPGRLRIAAVAFHPCLYEL